MTQPTPKLILHSDQSLEKTGAQDAQLIRSLTGRKAPRLGYIPSRPDPRRTWHREKAAYYARIGFPDLTYFDPGEGHTQDEISAFLSLDLIHLSGGEVIPFRDRLVATGFASHLIDYARKGGVILGVSAGAMLLGRSFLTATLFGEKGETSGLGLVDFEIVPHVAEKFPTLSHLRRFATTHAKTIYAMNDGDIITVIGHKVRTYGTPARLP